MNADHYLKCLLRAVLAGMSIGIGCCVFLGVWGTGTGEYKWVGAILFTIGLFSVFTFGFDLYTGKVGYAVENKPSFILDLVVIIIGNFIGCAVTGYMMPADAFAPGLLDGFVNGKLANPDYFRVLCKGIFCGVLMFIAADVYKTKKSYLGAFLCVPVFILAGFEHSIADMFYFCSAGAYTVEALVFILVVIVGNAIGGILIPLCRKYMYEEQKPAAQ